MPIAGAAVFALGEIAATLTGSTETYREYLRTVVSVATACRTSEDPRYQTVSRFGGVSLLRLREAHSLIRPRTFLADDLVFTHVRAFGCARA